MFPYLILIIVPLLLIMPIKTEYSGKPVLLTGKRNKRALVFFFSFYLLMLCLKSDYLGADTQQYNFHFIQISNMSWTDIHDYGYEIGFVTLYKLISAITDNFHYAVVIVSILSVIPVMLTYSKDNEFTYLKLVLFMTSVLFSGYFSGARQGVAIGIILLAYYMVQKKQVLRFIFLIFIASLFHVSAWIALLLYPAYYVKIKKYGLLIVVFLMFVIFYFREKIFLLALGMANVKFVERYGILTLTGAFTTLILYILFSLFVFVVTNENTRDEETSGLYNFMLIATVIQMFTSIAHGVGRLNLYFIIFIPMLIPKAIKCALPQYSGIVKFANIIMCIFFIIYFLLDLQSNTIVNIYPYKFFWQEV